MALQTVLGTYSDGSVVLDETPQGVKSSRVMVTFVPDAPKAGRSELRQRFIRRLEQGVDFGPEPLPTREELNADRVGRF